MNAFIHDFKTVWNKPNHMTIRLIIINIAIFLVFMIINVFSMASSSPMIYVLLKKICYIPAPIGEFMARPWTLITYFFVHNHLFHIGFNMLTLYWFGQIAEEYLGHRKMMVIYIYGGIVGGLLYLLMYNTLTFFINTQPEIGMSGASASVYAIVVGIATLLPNFGITLFFFGRVQLKYIAVFVVVLSLISSTGQNAGGNLAHLGGAFIGFFTVFMYQRGYDLGYPLIKIYSFFKKILTKKPSHKKEHHNKSYAKERNRRKKNTSTTGMPNQEEIDAILDKISQDGYESLTRQEKEVLFKASKK